MESNARSSPSSQVFSNASAACSLLCTSKYAHSQLQQDTRAEEPWLVHDLESKQAYICRSISGQQVWRPTHRAGCLAGLAGYVQDLSTCKATEASGGVCLLQLSKRYPCSNADILGCVGCLDGILEAWTALSRWWTGYGNLQEKRSCLSTV